MVSVVHELIIDIINYIERYKEENTTVDEIVAYGQSLVNRYNMKGVSLANQIVSQALLFLKSYRSYKTDVVKINNKLFSVIMPRHIIETLAVNYSGLCKEFIDCLYKIDNLITTNNCNADSLISEFEKLQTGEIAINIVKLLQQQLVKK